MNVKFFEIMQTNLKNNKIDLNSYFTCNNHFNADGHRILANIIEEKLINRREILNNYDFFNYIGKNIQDYINCYFLNNLN